MVKSSPLTKPPVRLPFPPRNVLSLLDAGEKPSFSPFLARRASAHPGAFGYNSTVAKDFLSEPCWKRSRPPPLSPPFSSDPTHLPPPFLHVNGATSSLPLHFFCRVGSTSRRPLVSRAGFACRPCELFCKFPLSKLHIPSSPPASSINRPMAILALQA